MGAMSVREFNSGVSKALARVEAGETIDITKNGQIIAELRPKPRRWLDDPERRAAYERALKGLEEGIAGLTAPASYDERTGR